MLLAFRVKSLVQKQVHAVLQLRIECAGHLNKSQYTIPHAYVW